MSKVILNYKTIPGMKSSDLHLKINGEKSILLSEGKQEIQVDSGENTLRVYENFMMKSNELKADIISENTEVVLTFNYTVFLIAFLINIFLVLTAYMQILGNYLFIAVILALIINFILMTTIGFLKLTLK